MNAAEAQTVAQLLMKRVTPRDAEEGVAISQLAIKLVQHFGVPKVPPPSPGKKK
jgi:hypothetical protein